jgi:hypothetical protein
MKGGVTQVRHRAKRAPVLLALASMLASIVMVVSPMTANAAESIPELQWPAVKVSSNPTSVVTSPTGSVTVPCNDSGSTDSANNLRTYSSTSQLTRELPKTEKVDGVNNCINWLPAVDKKGDLYGILWGKKVDGTDQSTLLAYKGNNLKWKYPVGCSQHGGGFPTVGADGNIYFTNNDKRLIGVTPDVEPGTALPKKVLDVPIANACSDSLQALKDGIAVTKDMAVTFYSYSGAYLGKTENFALRSYGVDQVSSNGRFFYASYIESSGLRSASISAYDYGRQQVAWKVTVSANGAYVYSADPFATPDGGTIVLLREKKLVNGVPTEEQSFTIVKLNIFGSKVWSKVLPNENAKSSFNNAFLKIDVKGNIVVIRDGQIQTDPPYNNSVPATSIGVFNSAGSIIFDKIMYGNLDKGAGRVWGYSFDSNAFALGPNTLFITAQECGEYGCFNGDTKLFPVKIAGLGLDYLRGAVFFKTPKQTAAYIAPGDSFSAGESLTPFESGTDIPNLNKCHRSSQAYPQLIAGSSPKIPQLGSSSFRACSGARSENIIDAPQWNEGIQLDLWPDTTTKLVTLTLGGNDIGFGDLAKACILEFASCGIGSTAYTNSLNRINNELASKLIAVYRKILQYAPNAKVFVIGYPQVMANKAPNDPVDGRCPYRDMHRLLVTQLTLARRRITEEPST